MIRYRVANVALILGLLVGLSASPAQAKSKKDLTYSLDVIWTTAMRYLRADRGYKLTDKDRGAGYILFVYPGTGSVKECHAAMEFVATQDHEQRKLVRLQLNIAHQPSYIELSVLDGIERKLREEQGAPPPPPPPTRKDEEQKPKGEDG